MDLSAAAKQYCETRMGVVPFGLSQSDPEFSALFANFAFDEVMQESRLDDKTRFLAILATLMGCQGIDAFCDLVPAALKSGVTAVELKELVYQAAAYLGLGRVLPFLNGANAALEKQGYPFRFRHRGPPSLIPGSRQATRRRWIFSGNRCGGSRTAARKRAGISIAGLRGTASAITTPEAAWITGSGN